MIHSLAVYFVDGCVKENSQFQVLSNTPLTELDQKDKTECAVYGLELIISSIINVFIIALLGILFHKIPETAIFLISFGLVRQYAGGYHAPNYLICTTSFTVIFCLVVLSGVICNDIMCYLLWSMSFITILLLAPVEDPNKPLGEKRRLKIRRKTYAMLIVETLVFFLCKLVGWSIGYVYITYALSIVAALLLAGQIKLCYRKDEV